MDSLVSTQWLAAERGSPGLFVLDASKHLPDAGRDARAEFEAGHIPGGRFLDMASLVDAGAPVVNTLPTPEQVAARMRALGIARDSRVVLYDDSRIRSAARAWFILRRCGLREVAILDGGLAKWRAEARALESGAADPAPSDFPAPGPIAQVRSKADMLANLRSGDEQVLDARDAARFGGIEAEGGHIPGARNLWFADLFEEDGTYKSPDELRALFAGAGIDLSRPIVTSCNSGVTAAVLLFALHLIGVEHAALYDGSWQEWSVDPETPKATGAAT